MEGVRVHWIIVNASAQDNTELRRDVWSPHWFPSRISPFNAFLKTRGVCGADLFWPLLIIGGSSLYFEM